jgi:hypothetical protein
MKHNRILSFLMLFLLLGNLFLGMSQPFASAVSGSIGTNIRSDGTYLYMTMEDGIKPYYTVAGGGALSTSIDTNSSIEGKYCLNMTASGKGVLIPFDNPIKPSKFSIKFIITKEPTTTGSSWITLCSSNFLTCFNFYMHFSNHSFAVDDGWVTKYFNLMPLKDNTIYELIFDDIHYVTQTAINQNYADVTLRNATSSQTLTDINALRLDATNDGQVVAWDILGLYCAPSSRTILYDDWTVGTQTQIQSNNPTNVEETSATANGLIVNDGSPLQNGTQTNLTAKVYYDTKSHEVNYTYYFNDYNHSAATWLNPNNMIDGNNNTISISWQNKTQILTNHTGNVTNHPTGNISKVEIKVHAATVLGAFSNNHIYFQPLLNHTIPLDKKQVSFLQASALVFWWDYTDWTEIVAPISWTWDMFKNLSVKIFAENKVNWALAICKVELKVTINASRDYAHNQTINKNFTGESLSKSLTLTPGQLYYYRMYGETNYKNASSYSWGDEKYFFTKPEAPTNTNFIFLNISYIRLNWTKGTGANNTVVVKKTTGMPASVTDGTIVYNGTGLNTNQTIVNGQPTYYRAWSYAKWISPSLHQFSTNGTNFTIGGLYINCYDVNTHANLTFNVTISNPTGTQVYVNGSCINTLEINATLCPQGTGIQVIVSAIGYKQSVYVLDIYPPIFYLLNTYLILATPSGTPSGNETSALYYLRVVESVQTGYTQVDQAVEDALVTVKRYINATGVYETISSLYTDANGYVNLYLAPNGYYKVFINKSGYYDKISDYIPAPPNAYGQTAEKVFRIVKIEIVAPPPVYEWSDYITFTGSFNLHTAIINVNYTDALTNTTNWQLFIYRLSGASLVLVTSWSGTNDSFILSKNVIDNASNYKVIFHVNHTNFGYNPLELYFYGYHPTPTKTARFNALFTLNYGYNPFGWANTFMFFIILGCFFSFGRRETYMAVFAIGFISLFVNYYIGIETVWSALAGGVFPVILIFFGILMLVRDRGYSGVS